MLEDATVAIIAVRELHITKTQLVWISFKAMSLWVCILCMLLGTLHECTSVDQRVIKHWTAARADQAHFMGMCNKNSWKCILPPTVHTKIGPCNMQQMETQQVHAYMSAVPVVAVWWLATCVVDLLATKPILEKSSELGVSERYKN